MAGLSAALALSAHAGAAHAEGLSDGSRSLEKRPRLRGWPSPVSTTELTEGPPAVPGAGGGWMPALACSPRMWPIRSPVAGGREEREEERKK